MPKYPNFLKRNIETLMFRDSIDQKTLAQKMGNTPAAVSRILSVANPTYETLERLAEVFSVKPFTLVMSPEDYAKWDSTRPASGVSAQEKLQSVAMLLSDAQAASLLEMATRYLTQSPEDRVKALEAMTSGTVRTRKSR